LGRNEIGTENVKEIFSRVFYFFFSFSPTNTNSVRNVNLRHQLENIILNSKFISPELTHPPRTRALARVLWLCVNSREVNFDEGFYPTDDVVYFISPKTVLEQLGELWYLILFTFMSMKI
jgi:hypothetical protein